ncbi:hypothetical protein [Amycolatopsis australiensis]|uniref:hypothetical protein n=1 Tax=Amycolatopsis australiensis TaxID=546364 RepID=UPI0009FC5CA7
MAGTLVSGVDLTPNGGRTYNLTVDRVHTYFVFAGETPVLVHNDRCSAKSGRCR